MKKKYVILARLITFTIVKLFKVKANISDDIRKKDGPFLILSNHVGTYDPFLVAYFLDTPVHYVASDAVLKDSLLGSLLKGLGVLPKKKNVKDSQLIRSLVSASKEGKAIGLFPEGVRTWTGTTLEFDEATAKLIKLLKIPVLTAKIKGLSLMNPRWAFKPRFTTKTEIDYSILFNAEEIKDLDVEEIHKKLHSSLQHNDNDYIKEENIKISSFNKAKSIEYTLFNCPKCNSIGKIVSGGNHFTCIECKTRTKVNSNGFFENNLSEEFSNIHSWHKWQENNFVNVVKEAFQSKSEEPIFSDGNMKVYIENTNNILEYLGRGNIYFYYNRIEVKIKRLQYSKTFLLEDIDTINPQFRERIEMYYKGKAYRFIGGNEGVSGVKYELAANTIWKLTNQNIKLSYYLNINI